MVPPKKSKLDKASPNIGSNNNNIPNANATFDSKVEDGKQHMENASESFATITTRHLA